MSLESGSIRRLAGHSALVSRCRDISIDSNLKYNAFQEAPSESLTTLEQQAFSQPKTPCDVSDLGWKP